MKHELLSPAGSFEILRAVIDAGADAVYIGGDRFGARAYARNFSQEEILKALDYAHLRGKKIFLTINTLLKNRELEGELFDYLAPLYCHGLDAVIIQDYGVFRFVRDHFPELPVHCSTQMSVADEAGTRFLQQQGAKRIVTARELSLKEIRRIYDATGVEIESFIHGALCYCYSGQCLMSSMLGGRSGNRGRCAQPCRLAYEVTDLHGNVRHKKEKYPLSPKDLCTINLLPKLCEAGVYSFKIEGRMKQQEYAAGVTAVYRKYLDLYEAGLWGKKENDRISREDEQQLLNLGNRNGFTQGYYEQHNGADMITRTDSSHSSGQISGKSEKKQTAPEKKMTLEASVSIRKDAYPVLQLKGPSGVEVTAVGEDPVEAAVNRPMDPAEIRKRLAKTGETPFRLAFTESDIDPDIFLPVSRINELRRTGLELMTEQLLLSYRREPVQPAETEQMTVSDHERWTPYLHVMIRDPRQLDAVLEAPFVKEISLDMFPQRGAENIRAMFRRIRREGKRAGFCMPYVLRSERMDVKDDLETVMREADRIWVRSYDGLGLIQDLGYMDKAAADDHLYVMSDRAGRAFLDAGLSLLTASPELNRGELRHMDCGHLEMVLYGYMPLMISAQCVYKNYDRCYNNSAKSPGDLFLRDRYQKTFRVVRDCGPCYNIIYNSQPTYLLHQRAELTRLGFPSYRISFTSEDGSMVRQILSDYERAFVKGEPVQPPKGESGFTGGHFRRGVE